MNLKNDTKNTVLIFMAAVLLGAFLSIVCSILVLKPYWTTIFSGMELDMLKLPREKMISLQVISMIGFFIVPPVMFSIYSKNEFLETFNLNRSLDLKRYSYAFLLAFVLFPILINFQYLVMQIPFPESWKEIAEAQRVATKCILELFLNHPGIDNLIFMIILIGFGAGLTEELFFRGLLLPLFQRWFDSKWVAIFLSSLFFSLFHLNAYDFLPILLVGCLFAYLYLCTGDLKLNIFIHAIYNGLQVFMNYLYQQGVIRFDIDNVDYVPIWLWATCLLVGTILYKLLLKKNEPISN